MTVEDNVWGAFGSRRQRYSESLPVREYLSERLKENSTCEIMADDCGPGSAVETALHGLV